MRHHKGIAYKLRLSSTKLRQRFVALATLRQVKSIDEAPPPQRIGCSDIWITLCLARPGSGIALPPFATAASASCDGDGFLNPSSASQTNLALPLTYAIFHNATKMSSTKLVTAQFPLRAGAVCTRLVPLATTRLFSMSASPGMPKKKAAAAASSSQNHKPQPTESEEDVSADRSPVDPLHAPKTVDGQSKPAGARKAKPSSGGHKPKTTSK